MTYTSFIQNRITKLRMARDISERRMSEELGKNPGYINQIVSGKTNPSLEMLIEICDYLGITLSVFFNNDVDEPELLEKLMENAKSLNEKELQTLIGIAEIMNSYKKLT